VKLCAPKTPNLSRKVSLSKGEARGEDFQKSTSKINFKNQLQKSTSKINFKNQLTHNS